MTVGSVLVLYGEIVMPLTFNNTFGAGVSAQYHAVVGQVEAFLSQQFTDNVSINITFNSAALNPGYVSGGFTHHNYGLV
jgi:small basic protein